MPLRSKAAAPILCDNQLLLRLKGAEGGGGGVADVAGEHDGGGEGVDQQQHGVHVHDDKGHRDLGHAAHVVVAEGRECGR